MLSLRLITCMPTSFNIVYIKCIAKRLRLLKLCTTASFILFFIKLVYEAIFLKMNEFRLFRAIW